jgi:acyl-coenzyme A thioesterase PaaI-like protein
MAAPALTRKELLDRLRIEFPDAGHAVGDYEIEELWRGGCRLRQRYDHRALRPGGTLSGATMMALGDFTMYLAVLSAIGWVPLAVTTNLTIFSQKAACRRPDCRGASAQARQTACRGRGGHPRGRRGRHGRPHDLNLFDPAGKIIP